MKKNVIVSLADANYYPLLNELVDSIKQFQQSENVAICILDAGLEPEQKKALIKKVDEIKSNYQMGFITNNERYNQVIDVWTTTNARLTDIVMKK